MDWERIRKRTEDYIGANLLDYEQYSGTFTWAQARALLDGLPGGGLNIAHEAVDRHISSGRGDKLALRWIGRDDRIRDFTFSALGGAASVVEFSKRRSFRPMSRNRRFPASIS